MLFPLYDTNPHQGVPVVTFVFIGINVLVFLWQSTLPQEREEDVLANYGFVPARMEQLVNPKKVVDVKFPRLVQHPVLPLAQQQVRVIRLRADRPAILFSIFSMMFLLFLRLLPSVSASEVKELQHELAHERVHVHAGGPI